MRVLSSAADAALRVQPKPKGQTLQRMFKGLTLQQGLKRRGRSSVLADASEAVSIASVDLGFGEGERAVRGLRELRATRLALASLERQLVVSARRSLVTWREIGEALGVTTQAAHRRFRTLDPTSRPRRVDPLNAELDALYRPAAPREIKGG